MNIFKKLLIGAACICLALGLTACDKKAEIDETSQEIYAIYELAVAEGETRSYTEWLEAIRGEDGEDGISPHIDSRTGHWFIGNYDTKIMAQGPQGEQGIQGEKGDKGEKGDDGLTPFVGDNGNWWIGSTDTGVNAGIQYLDADYNEDGFVDFLDAQFLKDCFLGKVEIGENKFSDLNGDGKINATDYLRLSGYGKGYYENEALDRIKYTYSVIFDYNTDLDVDTIFDTNHDYLHLNKNHTIAGLTLPTVTNNTNKYIFKGWYIEDTDRLIDENTYLKGDTTLVAKWIPNLDYNEDGFVDYGDIQLLKDCYFHAAEIDDSKYTDLNGDGRITSTDYLRFSGYAKGTYNHEVFDGVEYTYSVLFDYNTDLDIDTIFDTTPEYLHLNNHTIYNVELPNLKENAETGGLTFDGWYIKDTDNKVTQYMYFNGDIELVARWKSAE